MNDHDQRSSVPQRLSGRATAGWGIVVGLIGVVLILSPLLLGNGSLNKYIVTVGLLGLCLGLGFVLHGLWDWWQEAGR